MANSEETYIDQQLIRTAAEIRILILMLSNFESGSERKYEMLESLGVAYESIKRMN